MKTKDVFAVTTLNLLDVNTFDILGDKQIPVTSELKIPDICKIHMLHTICLSADYDIAL